MITFALRKSSAKIAARAKTLTGMVEDATAMSAMSLLTAMTGALEQVAVLHSIVPSAREACVESSDIVCDAALVRHWQYVTDNVFSSDTYSWKEA